MVVVGFMVRFEISLIELRFRFMARICDKLGKSLMVILCLKFRVRLTAMNCFWFMGVLVLILDCVFWFG